MRLERPFELLGREQTAVDEGGAELLAQRNDRATRARMQGTYPSVGRRGALGVLPGRSMGLHRLLYATTDTREIGGDAAE